MDFVISSKFEVGDVVEIGEGREENPDWIWNHGKIITVKLKDDKTFEYLIEYPSLERFWVPEHLIIGYYVKKEVGLFGRAI